MLTALLLEILSATSTANSINVLVSQFSSFFHWEQPWVLKLQIVVQVSLKSPIQANWLPACTSFPVTVFQNSKSESKRSFIASTVSRKLAPFSCSTYQQQSWSNRWNLYWSRCDCPGRQFPSKRSSSQNRSRKLFQTSLKIHVTGGNRTRIKSARYFQMNWCAISLLICKAEEFGLCKLWSVAWIEQSTGDQKFIVWNLLASIGPPWTGTVLHPSKIPQIQENQLRGCPPPTPHHAASFVLFCIGCCHLPLT